LRYLRDFAKMPTRMQMTPMTMMPTSYGAALLFEDAPSSAEKYALPKKATPTRNRSILLIHLRPLRFTSSHLPLRQTEDIDVRARHGLLTAFMSSLLAGRRLCAMSNRLNRTMLGCLRKLSLGFKTVTNRLLTEKCRLAPRRFR
jgi:hypothetical protein